MPLLLTLLRVTSSIMAAAALAALIAAVVTAAGAARADALRPLVVSAVAFGGSLGAGAAGMALLMPRASDLIHRSRNERDAVAPWLSAVLLTGLACAAILQASSAARSWAELVTLLPEVTFAGADPLGFNLIPTVILFFVTALTMLAFWTCVLVSIVSILAPPSLAARTLAACVVLLCGLAGGVYTAQRGIHSAAAAAREFLSTEPEAAEASARLARVVGRYDAATTPPIGGFLLIVGGYIVALAPVSRRRAAVRQDAAAPAPSAAPFAAPFAAPPALPLSSPHFTESLYSVRPRPSLLGVFAWWHSEYEIASIPPRRASAFSLSWTRATVRREPDGPDLLSIRSAGGMWTSAEYHVAEADSDAAIGSIVREGSSWNFCDPSGTPVAAVREIEAGARHARFVADADGRQVCAFAWGLQGLTVGSAELQVEFSPGADARVRALALVVGPILEQRARRVSYRAT